MGTERVSASVGADAVAASVATAGEVASASQTGQKCVVSRGLFQRSLAADRQAARYARKKSAGVFPPSNYLQRLRVLEGAGRFPSVEPFDKIILSFDFYRDIRDEKCRKNESVTPGEAAGSSAAADYQTLENSASTPAEKPSSAPSNSSSLAKSQGDSKERLRRPAEQEKLLEDVSASDATHGADAPATPVARQDQADASAPVDFESAVNSDEDDSDDEFCASRLRPVQTYFSSTEEYVDTFFPLFIQEAKQSIHRAKKMEMSRAERFVQVSGDPQGDFILLTLERAQGLNQHASHYCHNDLVVLYVPDKAAAGEASSSLAGSSGTLSLAKQGGGASRLELSAGVDEAAKKDLAVQELFAEEDAPQMSPEDTELQLEQARNEPNACCHDLTTVRKVHMLGIVQQSLRSTLVVKILMPLLSPPGDPVGALCESEDETTSLRDTRAGGAAEEDRAGNHGNSHDGDTGDADPSDAHRWREARRRAKKQKRRKAKRERILALTDALNDWQTTWHVCRVMGLTTLHREFQGLMSVPDLLIKKQILCASQRALGSSAAPLKNPLLEDLPEESPADPDSGSAEEEEADRSSLAVASEAPAGADQGGEDAAAAATCQQLFISSKLREALHQLYNASQLDALNDCLKIQGVTLIQGPPGTGKTTTIMAVISVVLNAQMENNDGTIRGTRCAAAAIGDADGCVGDSMDCSEDTRSAGERLNGTEKTKAKRREAEALKIKRKLALAQPWLSLGGYTPWMDEVSCMTEDLEGSDAHWSASATAKGGNESQRVFLDKGRNALLPNRVLVCAPSNAAIDEILKRLVAEPSKGGGIFDSNGKRYTPSVVRVGPNVHPDLIQYSLEYKANKRMKAKGATHFSALAAIKAEILQESRIVCATLSVCGCRDITAATEAFDTVVIDEASQGVEISTLIPLRLGCRRLILVGDPRQLPATIFSRVAIQHRYDQSLFQRLEAAGHKVNMLSLQYRMHPCISRFASSTFYQNQLQDAVNIVGLVRPPVPWYSIPIFKPLVFFAINTSHTEENTSLINVDEANFVCQMVDLLRRIFVALGQSDWEGRLAVISPYAQQVSLLRRRIKAQLGITDNKACPIDVNTVDGFQGQEKDLIIFSAVRAQHTNPTTAATTLDTSIGFLADERRINVALTRGRTNLWIVGNGRFLMTNHHWRCLWKYTKELGTLISIEEKFMKTELLLAKWLLKFTNKHPAEKSMLDEQVPSFLPALEKDVKECAAARKTRKISSVEGDPAAGSSGKE
ncbi:RNA-directed RNA polymerase [Besnoitia besnoiti]|uniref:RNA-directed RNA polymerase n=1 Tax=Besnoitia besnoiti TaxID=94643 RepID=A0A2A9ME56_BESBE|nr:RNA-directed RNA polymerase [Besnoitia besnoiti]PFH36275.1 RNA-directed RNA polymerase [Besnoitia besnoiti]